MFNQGSSSSLGVFVNGTPATTIQGSGGLSGFTFRFSYSDLTQNQTAGGALSYNGYWPAARRQLLQAGFNNWFWDDRYNKEHVPPPGTSLMHFRSPGETFSGANSAHLILDIPANPRSSIPETTQGEMHLGEHNPFALPFGPRLHCREIGMCQ